MTDKIKSELVAIMRELRFSAFLATDDDGQPVIRPMSPIVEDDLTVWLVTFSSSNKIKQLKANNRICLAFADTKSWKKEVTIFGRAEIIDDLTAKQHVWNISGESLEKYFPEGAHSPKFCLLNIQIDKVQWRCGEETVNKTYLPE
ncbi:pyridoxamine 5'-phosphate oxidase family protein [bacterium]|nr:pyridoxamine 5'-phosphate oxidase family protein [candidate division CSSED10-310 bacterium]